MKSTFTFFRFFIFSLVFAPLLVSSQSIIDNQPIRFNAGGDEVRYGNILFEAGNTYAHTTNGETYSPNLEGYDIANTDWDEIHKTESFHQNLRYNIPVRDNACYQVRIHFAEIYFDSPGGRPEPEWGRIFDVIVQGELKMDDYNIIKVEGSAMKAAVYTYEVCLGEGEQEIRLEFPARSGLAKVSAIEILPECGDNCLGEDVFPVEILSFEAENSGKSTKLKWITAWEENNAGFEVQKSRDAKHFVSIASLNGTGSSDEATTYEFTDQSPFNGINYYRLKQIDFDGSITFSDLVEVRINRNASKLNIYPNPAPKTATVTLALESFHSHKALIISVRDLNGQLKYREKLHTNATGSLQTQLRINPHLTQGIYLVTIGNGQEIKTQRLIIL